MIKFVAAAHDAGRRVDVVLAEHAGVTRTHAQRALRDGSVTVGGAHVRPSHRLDEGDEVEGTLPAAVFSPPQPEDIPLTVAYEDDRVLVVSKPPGLVVHPARGHRAGTLVNALLGRGGPLAAATSVRPGIVHRLDKDTSGLLLVARDDDARDKLVDALRAHDVARRYVALVRGRPPAASGTVDAPVGRHPTRRTLMAVVEGGRPSVTHYRVLDEAGGATLLELSLETGRTHQIRVHMAHVGHPVVGDRTYGGGGEPAARLGLARPFLHAWRLRFPHPDDGRPVDVADPLPDDLGAALAALGLGVPAP